MSSVKDMYLLYLRKLEELVAEKQDWREYTRDEQYLVSNTFKLVALMESMCTVNLVKRDEKKEKLETVNRMAVNDIANKADKLLNTLYVQEAIMY